MPSLLSQRRAVLVQVGVLSYVLCTGPYLLAKSLFPSIGYQYVSVPSLPIQRATCSHVHYSVPVVHPNGRATCRLMEGHRGWVQAEWCDLSPIDMPVKDHLPAPVGLLIICVVMLCFPKTRPNNKSLSLLFELSTSRRATKKLIVATNSPAWLRWS